MSRSDFLDTLCQTDFGKIICINLFRSIRLGTLTSEAVKAFLDQCVARQATAVTGATLDSHQEIALRVATSWDTRAALVKKNLFPSPPSTDQPIQFATVLPVNVFTRNATSAIHKTYSPRRVSSESEFSAVLKQWLSESADWIFGLDKSYFWLARPVNFSSVASVSLDKGLAQFYVDTLGLCHFGRRHNLLRALVPSNLMPSAALLFRPSALDGIDNPAFRAAIDKEFVPPPKQPGTTLDMRKLRQNLKLVDGQHEWLCEPLRVQANSVGWEFLGTPKYEACNNDHAFHAIVLTQLEQNTPVLDAAGYLKAIS